MAAPRINRTSKPVLPSSGVNPFQRAAQQQQGQPQGPPRTSSQPSYAADDGIGWGSDVYQSSGGYGPPGGGYGAPGGGYGAPGGYGGYPQGGGPGGYGGGGYGGGYGGYGGGYGGPVGYNSPSAYGGGYPPPVGANSPAYDSPSNPPYSSPSLPDSDPSSPSPSPSASLPPSTSDASLSPSPPPSNRQTGVFSAVGVVRGEMVDIVDDASQYRDYVKGMQGRKVTEQDAEWLKERKDDLEQRLQFVHEMMSQCQAEMDPEEYQDVSQNFALLCAQLQAMFKVAAKRERKRYTVTQEAGAMGGGVAMESGDIARQLEMEAAAMQNEEVEMRQNQQYELNIDPRWSIAHPLLHGGQLQEFTDDDLIQERQQELLYIQQESERLAALMEQQNAQVLQQEEKVLIVEENTLQSQDQVDEGVQHILKASSGRKYKMVAAGGLVAGAAIGAGAGAIAGPVGMIAGAAVGAAVGFGIGYGGAMAMQHKRDLDSFRLYLDKKWVNDKDAKQCADCKKSFTQKRRRHHCRHCGNVFCGKCTSKRIKLPKVDWKRAERVCNSCFTAILELNYQERKQELSVESVTSNEGIL